MTRTGIIIAALAATSSLAAAQEVAVKLSEFTLVLSRDTVKAGTVYFRITNEGRTTHAVKVTGNGVEQATREIARGEAATLRVRLPAGTYDVFCPLADGSHRMAGMAKQLIVTAPAPTRTEPKKPGG